MRCIFGVVLWVILCYCGNQTLGAVATARANSQGLSQRAAEAAGWKVFEKYHALVYVAAGLISLAACSVPTLLTRNTGFNEEEEWRRIAERSQHSA